MLLSHLAIKSEHNLRCSDLLFSHVGKPSGDCSLLCNILILNPITGGVPCYEQLPNNHAIGLRLMKCECISEHIKVQHQAKFSLCQGLPRVWITTRDVMNV